MVKGEDRMWVFLLLGGLFGLGFLFKRSYASTIRKTDTAIKRQNYLFNSIFSNHTDIKSKVKYYKERYNLSVPERVVYAIIKAESGFNPWAKNPHSTAYGLFQMIKSTREYVANTICPRILGHRCNASEYLNDIDEQVKMGLALAEYYWRLYRSPYKVFLAWCSPAEANGRITKYHNYCIRTANIKYSYYRTGWF